MFSSKLISEQELAEELDVKPSTLKTWRCRRRGPPWISVARNIFYDRADIERWLKAQRRDPAKLRRVSA
jgi:hypothetical protein